MIKTSIYIGLILGIRGGKILVDPNLSDQPDANLYIRFILKQVTGWSGKFYKLSWLYSVWFGFLFWVCRNLNYPDQPVNLLIGFYLIHAEHLQKKKKKNSKNLAQLISLDPKINVIFFSLYVILYFLLSSIKCRSSLLLLFFFRSKCFYDKMV